MHDESSAPFQYLGLLRDYNGLDVHQSRDHITISCASYISRVLKTHGWDKPNLKESDPPKAGAPLPMDCITQLYSAPGHTEGSPEHRALEKKEGFAYRTLLGELLYAYVTCRPDIGYAVTTLSKFSTCPAPLHFAYLKQVTKYLRRTINWGIVYKKPSSDPGLPESTHDVVPVPDNLPVFPTVNPDELICFADAAHANDLRKRCSTTGYVFLYAGGAVLYRSKTQSLTATSSTEAEFIAAVTAAKQGRYLRAILRELGFAQSSPTLLYEDNMSAINMVNNSVPTDRSRHIDIQYFAIQDWKSAGDLIMRHIPGVINPPDALTKPLGWVLHSRHVRRMMGHHH